MSLDTNRLEYLGQFPGGETAPVILEERYRLAVEAVPGILYDWDLQTGYVYRSAGVFALLGFTPEEAAPTPEWWMGRVHPDDAEMTRLLRADSPADRTQYESEYRVRHRDGSYKWVWDRARVVRNDSGEPIRIVGNTVDISDRKQAEAEREAALLAVAASEYRFRLLTDSLPVMISYIDSELCYVLCNRTYYEWFGYSQEEIKGKHVREVLGETAFQQRLPHLQVVLQGETVHFEGPTYHQAKGNRLTELTYIPDRAEDGTVRGFVALIQDVTERRFAEARNAFLVDLAERTRHLMDPEAVVWETVQATGQFFSLSRYLFADIDTENDQVIVHRDYCLGEEVVSVAGTWPLGAWGPVIEELAAGRTVVNRDYKTDRRTASQYEEIYTRTDIRANVTVPLHRNGRWVAVFSAQMCGIPRNWTDEEIRLLETIARQMWLTMENARLYQKARREEERFRALVEASNQMVWRTGDDGLIEDMPEWRYYTGQTVEQVRGYGWTDAIHPEDVERVRATWLAAYEARGLYACEYRIRGKDGIYRWFFARGVPIFSPEGQLKEYIGTWQNIHERKLVESEREQYTERQQRVAETLQRSLLLTPRLDSLTGLDLYPVYEAASDETLVGGDFYDAFVLSPDTVALVVGDVTGKGIEAAAYTAEVKYALRALLREHGELGRALERLNGFLREAARWDHAENDRLYVPLAVVLVDHRRQVLTWACAGAEPPVLLHQNGTVREAESRGPMLGMVPQAHYTTETLACSPGDLLVLTTDGITEARQGRDRFFGLDGLVKALEERTQETELAAVALHVVECARRFAGGSLSDDVCLLLIKLGQGDRCL